MTFKSGIVIVVQIIHADSLVIRIKCQFRDSGTDETGTARDEEIHDENSDDSCAGKLACLTDWSQSSFHLLFAR